MTNGSGTVSSRENPLGKGTLLPFIEAAKVRDLTECFKPQPETGEKNLNIDLAALKAKEVGHHGKMD